MGDARERYGVGTVVCAARVRGRSVILFGAGGRDFSMRGESDPGDGGRSIEGSVTRNQGVDWLFETRCGGRPWELKIVGGRDTIFSKSVPESSI
jgi:hypothetical protein